MSNSNITTIRLLYEVSVLVEFDDSEQEADETFEHTALRLNENEDGRGKVTDWVYLDHEWLTPS